ncbi:MULTISPECIES: hypothetical protein [Corynebacterium]|uniref:Uncharacterized protein n=1 Tax=Corynebacterium hadale TaxID=2026255 RepID=A0A269PF47_9CORY|nr:hypothetical protein [Corynebacterium hadale]PAJ69717.1 hypothetical protein CIG21_07345 [Corynebacterium hadale]WKC60435.1 hypothetical protein CHAD_07850 [Corynebacterium hadale]
MSSPAIPLDQYLADTEPAPLPDLTWEEAKAILTESKDPETHVAAIAPLARNFSTSRSIPGKEVLDVLADSPVALWAVMMLQAYDAAQYSPLDLYRFVEEAEAPSQSDELIAMHHWATAVLHHEAPLEDPNTALAGCRAFLEVSDGHNWVRPDIEIAGIVLEAAVEYPDGPIGPVGTEIMRQWEERLTTAIEAVDPDFAYTENQLLSIWKDN